MTHDALITIGTALLVACIYGQYRRAEKWREAAERWEASALRWKTAYQEADLKLKSKVWQ